MNAIVVSALTYLSISAIAIVILWWIVHRSPVGYEDCAGWHPGPEPKDTVTCHTCRDRDRCG